MNGMRPGRLLLQALNYTIFMAMVWYFSIAPPYRQIEDEQAVVTLAFGHAAKRVSECVQRSTEEMKDLAPNMRLGMDCPRERSPLKLELSIDGEPAVAVELVAPGLYNDQGVDVYRETTVTAGQHVLKVVMNDDVNVSGPTHTLEQTVDIGPAQRLVVSFDNTNEKFTIR